MSSTVLFANPVYAAAGAFEIPRGQENMGDAVDSIDFPFVNKTISDKHPLCDDRQYTGIGPDREQRDDCGNPNASTLQARRRADGDVRPLVVCRGR
jgi:hypothetical protein